jgi:hypothetical protein
MIEAMAPSRWLLPNPSPGHIYHPDVEFDDETANFIKAQKHEQGWGKAVRKPYKLASKQDVYVPLKRCDIAKKNGEIVISCRVHYPSKNNGDCWGYATPEMSPYVVLPDTASAEEIGAGLRLDSLAASICPERKLERYSRGIASILSKTDAPTEFVRLGDSQKRLFFQAPDRHERRSAMSY